MRKFITDILAKANLGVEQNAYVLGTVGIGTSTPSYKLHVEGTIYSPVYTSGSITINSGDFLFAADGGGDGFQMDYYNGQMYIGNNAGTSWHMVMQDNGNIGIGTTSPADKLQVVASTYNGITIITPDVATFKMRSTSGTTSWGFATTNLAASDFGIYQSNSGGGDPINAGTARLYFNGSGNVGIGTTAPTSKLHVWNGGIKTTGFPSMGNPFTFLESNYSDAAVTVRFQNINPTNNLEADLGIQLMNTGGSMADVLRIKGATGNVGIGTTSPGAKLDVNGDISSSPLGLNVGGYNFYSQTISGVMGILGHNLRASNSVANQVNVVNSGWYSSMIKQYYSEGITFHTSATSYTAGDVYPIAATERMRITSGGNVLIGTTTDDGYKLNVNGSIKSQGILFERSPYETRSIGLDSSGWYFYNNSDSRYDMLIDTNGNVGIGTTSPDTRLDLAGGILSMGALNSGTEIRLRTGFANNGSGGVGITPIDHNGGNADGLGLYGSDGMSMWTSQTERMRITSGGVVGIATSSPYTGLSTRLYVGYDQNSSVAVRDEFISVGAAGGSTNTAGINFLIYNAGYGAKIYTDDNLVRGLAFDVLQNGTFYNAMSITRTSSPNVGIGTTSPAYKLDVNGGDLRVSSGANTRLLLLNTSTNGLNYSIYSADTGNLIFGRTGIADYMTIANGGNVGIGIANPAAKLHVVGAVAIGQNTNGTATIDAYGGKAYYGCDGTQITVAGNTGNVGIGTTSPGARLQVNGASLLGGTLNSDWAVSVDNLGTTNANGMYVNIGASSTGVPFAVYKNFSSLFYVNNSGNVGIGTTSPAAKLDVQTSSTNLSLRLGNTNGTNWDFYSYNDTNLYINNTLGTKLTILNNNGNVGIGTTSPSAMLDIYHATNGYASVGLQGYSTAAKWFLTSGISGDTIQDFSISHNNDGTSPVFRLSNSTGAATFSSSVTATQYNISNSNQTISIANTSDIQINAAAAGSNILFRAAGDERMRITSTGNVGIGTTSPGAQLSIFDTNNSRAYQMSFGYGSTETFRLGNNNATGKFTFTQLNNNNGFRITSSAPNATGIIFDINTSQFAVNGDTGNVGIGTGTPNYKLHVSGNVYINETLFVNQLTTVEDSLIVYDNLGVGTTSPQSKLHVAAANDRAALRLQNTAAAKIWEIIPSVPGVTNAGLSIFNVTDGAVPLYVSDGGNVGIGTTSPTEKLHIVGSNALQIIQSTTAGQNSTLKFITTARTWGIGANMGLSNSNLEIYDYTASANRLTIDSSGNVGIGTTSPTHLLSLSRPTQAAAYQLNINNAGGISDGNFTGIRFSQDSNAATELGNIKLHYYSTGATDLSFGTRLSPTAVYIQSGGNVGIGTTSPSARLSLGSASQGHRITWEDYSNIFSEYSSGDLWLSSNFYGNVGSSGYKTSLTASYGAAGISVSGTGGGLNGVLKFFVDNLASKTAGASFTPTERMRIIGNGHVGIGTTSPETLLHINGSGNTFTRYTNTSNSGHYIDIGANGAGESFVYGYGAYPILFGTNATERMRITAGGNVGIGTTSPQSKLHVSSSGESVVRIQDLDGTNQFLDVGHNGGTSYFLSTNNTSNGNFTWYLYNGTSFTVPMYISTSGNVGIGTTSPSDELTVNSAGNSTGIAIQRSGVTKGLLEIGSSSDTFAISATSATGLLGFNTNSTERMRIASDGNVGIGTSSPSSILQLGSGSYTTTNSSYNSFNSGGFGVLFRNDYDAYITFNTVYGASGWVNKYSAYKSAVLNFNDGALDISTGTGITAGSASNLTSRLTMTNGGNVGIGTTSPVEALHIAKSGGGRAILEATSGSGVKWQMNSWTDGKLYIGVYQIADYLTLTSGGNVGIGTTSPVTKLQVVGGSISIDADQPIRKAGDNSIIGYSSTLPGINIGSGAATDMVVFNAGGVERVRINTSGNVGIGTTSPAYLLDVRKNQAAYTYIAVDNANTPASGVGSGFAMTESGTVAWYLRNERDGSGKFNIGNTSNRLTIDSVGNVGIGTTSPAAKLDVQGNIYANGDIRSQGIFRDYQGEALLQTDNSAVTILGSSGASTSRTLAFYAGNTERMRILQNGNVGIGTTSPVSISGYTSLDINNATNGGLIQLSRAGVGFGQLYNNASEVQLRSIAAVPLVFGTNSSEKMRITSAGNVGIGTTSPSYNLHVEGNVSGISIYASHDIAAFSDITVKKEVKRIENAIEKVKELNGYTYVRTDDETGTRRAGVIAQEVQKVLPEVVSANPDGTLNVAYSNMIALLIEGMKEQQKEIDELKKLLKK